MQLNYSFIIPVFNRPDEIRELLESMKKLSTDIPFEVVIVEDGSTLGSEEEIWRFSGSLDISYYYKENSGPGDSRNFGMKKAKGNYFLILDSDVVLPENYLAEVDRFLKKNYVDCFGGRDAAAENFTPIQKAIDFAMTSFLTTGGVRGNDNPSFEPRSFNMGISKQAFEATGGFGTIHPGEDPDLSLRIRKAGFQTAFASEVFVYHKRRIDWRKFYVQVNKFGKARPILSQWHPGSGKLTFWFPSLFIIGLILSLAGLLFGFEVLILFYLLYFLMIFAEAVFKNNRIFIGLLSVLAVIIQFYGYGIGFLKSTWHVRLLKKDPEEVFPELFFQNKKKGWAVKVHHKTT